MIRDNGMRHTMDYVYVLHVELSNTEGSIRMTEWHKMTILREFVNHTTIMQSFPPDLLRSPSSKSRDAMCHAWVGI